MDCWASDSHMDLAVAYGPMLEPHMGLHSQAQMSRYWEDSHHGLAVCNLRAVGTRVVVAARHGGRMGSHHATTPRCLRIRRMGRAPNPRACADLNGVCVMSVCVLEDLPPVLLFDEMNVGESEQGVRLQRVA